MAWENRRLEWVKQDAETNWVLPAGIFLGLAMVTAPAWAPFAVEGITAGASGSSVGTGLTAVGAAAGGKIILSRVPAGPVRFGPMNPGPLPEGVANTFRSSSYTMKELTEPTVFYRVYGGTAGPVGSFLTRVKPSGPLQAQLDSALNPEWGNTATSVATIRVPAGTTIYEGAAASQPIAGGGSVLGGGSQVYIPQVDSSWLVP